jgi:hypothetical protein
MGLIPIVFQEGVLMVEQIFPMMGQKIKSALSISRRHYMHRMIAMGVAKCILSESPDYTPESMVDFTLDIMNLAESLYSWSEDGEDMPVMNFFVRHEVDKYM